MKIVVSACLLGQNCKYNGGNNLCPAVVEYVRDKEVIPVCPEMEAGFGCPRVPMEIVDGVLMNRDGVNLDGAMRRTVADMLQRLSGEKIDCAVLKARSPTCGVGKIYDGTFSGTLTDGSGIFAQALADAGIRVFDENAVKNQG